MTHEYRVAGIHDRTTSATVQRALKCIGGVEAVVLNKDRAVVTMSRHITTEEINRHLAQAGDFSLTDKVQAVEDHLVELTEHGHESAISRNNHGAMDHSKMDHGKMGGKWTTVRWTTVRWSTATAAVATTITTA